MTVRTAGAVWSATGTSTANFLVPLVLKPLLFALPDASNWAVSASDACLIYSHNSAVEP